METETSIFKQYAYDIEFRVVNIRLAMINIHAILDTLSSWTKDHVHICEMLYTPLASISDEATAIISEYEEALKKARAEH